MMPKENNSESVALRLRLEAAGWRPGQRIVTEGFSPRKRKLLLNWLKPWMGDEAASVCFVWGARRASTTQLPCIWVEDGMLRSVGLGADLVQPISWVFDTRGMYFDASGPSDLEHLLKNHPFHAESVERAAALRKLLVDMKITKYNLAGDAWQRPAQASHVILVAGQVESDASIRLGSAHISSNMALLEAVRRMRPNSFILYKPHPDVQAGLRAGALPAQAQKFYDELVTLADTNHLYSQVDELHVISSLSGFEALLRGLKVVCHGMPFYAGWGLCEAPNLSSEAMARRGRVLSVDEMVAGVLLEYASYCSPVDGSICSAEQAVRMLAEQAANKSSSSTIFTKPKRMALAAWARWRGYF